MPVGHLRLLSLFSECKSSPAFLALDHPHHIYIFFQNRRMGPQCLCISTCTGSMVSWSFTKYLQYVSYSPAVSTMFSFPLPGLAKIWPWCGFLQIPLELLGLTRIKAERGVFPNSRKLHHLAFAQNPGQRCGYPGG